ncbi:hypothetical protein JCM3774_004970 [Rhodotorula dairenensis]|uniref:eS10 family ribosomal protein n=1 Tax=Rhodotorula pacifica TaxID=1495444 RepID=UPI003179F4B0
MIIPKADRRTIYENLFKDGVLVAKKDFEVKHQELDVKNLFVIKACQSLTSRGYLTTHFSWQYYYYVLTPEGIDYLREYLNIPAEIVPATLKKQVRAARPGQGAPREGGAYRAPRADGADGYRRRAEGGKEGGAGGDFKPRFAGVGRGGPRTEA